jgi:hypothetical protein
LGDREIVVPMTPLSHASISRRDVDLRGEGDDCLVLAPVPRATQLLVPALAWLIVAGTFATTWVLGLLALAQGGWWGLIFLLLGSPFLVLAYFMGRQILFGKGPPRFRFDRRAGQLQIDRRHGVREYRREATHPLSEVLALQLLYSGYHAISQFTEHTNFHEQFYTYEMNLLLNGAPESRLHLCTHSDWPWMRESGRRLADFLGVPVVDQLHHGG